MKQIKYLAALMVCASLANAAIITPTSVTNSGTYAGIIADAGSSLTSLIDGSGLTGAPVDDGTSAGGSTHIGGFSNIEDKWVTATAGAGADFFAAANGTVQLDFDLGGAYDIASAYIWGYFNWGAGNSATAIDVSFSTDGVSYGNTQSISLDIPPVNDLPANAADLSNAPTGVTHVRFLMKDNGFGATGASGGDRVGLGEVRFGTTSVAPQPVVISSFTAIPPIVPVGGTTTLSWVTTHADTLTLDPGGIDVTGLTSTQVVVTAETTYELTAANSIDNKTEFLTVTIGEPGLLIDPSLELAFGGTSGTPNTGWFTFGSAVAEQRASGNFWNIANADGLYAAYAFQVDENSGGSIYQSVELDAGTTYRLTVAVAQSDSIDKSDGKYALVFYNSNFSELEAATSNVVGMTALFADDFVEFTPTSDGIYNVGMRNMGYVPGTGGDNDESTIFFDNVRLTSTAPPPPTDPIGDITISGPVNIPGGQGITLSWETSNKQSYDIQYKNNLVIDPDWTTIISNVTGTGSEITITTAVNNAETFYQVVTP